MTKPWSEVAASPAFKSLPPEDQDSARKQYFDDVVAPRVPPEQHEAAFEQFSADTGMGRRELPAGVAPSVAGGGRGRVNPGAQPAPTAIAQPAEPTPAGDPSGAGDAAAIMAAAQPARTSVLEGRLMPEPQFDAAEADRLSSRSYAEATPAPGTPRPAQSVRASGPREAPSKATERGEALVNAAPPIRALFKGVAGIAQGAGGLMRSVGDVTGIDPLSRAGASTAKGAEEFEQGMGTHGSIDGFGPKSPVPYLTNQAEGAASSLGQSAYYASLLGPRAVIPLMSVMSAGTEYDKARNAGMNPAEALAGAVPKGAFEAIGEKFSGLDKVAGAMGTLLTKGASAQAKKGAADILVKSGIKEIPGEVVTYLGQTGVDLLPGIGLNPDLTMSQFVDGLRDTVVQAGMMGTAMGAGGAVVRTDPRIKRLREAGDTGAADLLQQQLDKANTAASVDSELTGIAPLADFAATPEFQADYRLMRTEGVKPVEAAGRSALTSTFRGLASTAGMPEKALNAALEAAKKVKLDKLPGFLQRYTASLAAKGLIQPVESVDALGATLEQTRDHAMNAAIGATLPPENVRSTMDSVQALENAQNPGFDAESGQPVAENATSVAQTPVSGAQAAELPASAYVDFAAHDAATSPLNSLPEPTQAQKEAGNYKVGRVQLHGLNISIENPEGSTRRGVDPETGKPWENTLAAHYGYIRGTEGNDGDHVDTFIGPNPASDKVFVVDQVNKDGTFDEHKVMLGADSLEQADELYHANYAPGWTGRGAITEMPLADFKSWVRDGVKTQPLGSQVQAAQQQQAKATAPDVQNSPVRPPVTTETASQAAAAQTGAPAGGEAEGAAAAGSDAGTAALETPRVILGRNNVPLDDGGRAFKTRLAADEARKLNPAMRVIRAEGGFALTEKTPAQLAAQENAARRLRNPQTSPPGQPIPAHAMIAAAGGLAPAERADMGMDGNVTVGNRKLFGGEGKGLSIERATEKLIEEGYLPEGAGHDQARALIKRSLTQPQYTAEGTERLAEADKQAKFEAAMAEDEAVAQVEALSDNQFDALDSIEWDADSNTTTEAAMKALGFTDQEIQDATANQSREPQDDRSGRGEPDKGATSQTQGDSASRAQATQPAEEVTQTPADAGVSTSAPAFESKLRDDGTLAITGDPKAIREALSTIPAKSLMGMRGGILVGRTQADKAAAILRGETPKLSAREAAEAGQAARDAEKKAKQAAARAKPAPSGLTVGIMPGNAEPITVKDGVVFIGKSEAYDFDSGEPVTVPAGATDKQIVDALKDAGALSRRQRVFGLGKEEGEGLTAPTKEDVLAQQQRKEDGEKAEVQATSAAENKAKADAARGEFTLTGSDRPADVGAAGGQKGMFARGAAVVRQSEQEYTQPYETDLFGNPLPAPARKSGARGSVAARVPGDVQSASAVPAASDQYFVDTVVGTETLRRLGADKIETPEQAAQATAYLYKSAVERFDAIVTDKNHKPLAVVGGFKGATNQTNVYPATVMGEAIRIPGAAHIWFSHNHPSGNAQLSSADEHTNTKMSDVFDGSGIKPMGLLAVGGENFGYVSADGTPFSVKPIPPSTSEATVPAVERRLVKNDKSHIISAPWEAKAVAKKFYQQGGPGILLLTSNLEVAGWVPVSGNLTGMLRNTGGLARLYEAVSRSNATGAILVDDGTLDVKGVKGSITAAENIMAALPKVDVRPLDVINVKTDVSKAEIGLAIGRGPVYARKGFDADAFSRMFRPPTAMPISEVQKAVDQLSKSWKSGPDIKVVATPADLPINAPADARGLIHDGTAYVVAGNHLNRDGVARTLGHEAIGHYGLWRMLGEDGQARFERNLQLAIKSGNVPLGKIAAKVRAAYVDSKGKFNLSPTEEANEIAAFAVEAAIDPATGEFKPGFGFVKEVFAKVAEFLRSLGIDVKFTNAELQGMLMAAMRGLKAGHRLEGGGQALVAAARDGAGEKPETVGQQSKDPDTSLPQFAGRDGLFIGFAAPTERLEFIPTSDNQQMLNFVIMRDGEMIGSADLLFEDGKLSALYDIEVDQARRGKGDGAAVIRALLASDPSRNVEISNIIEQARNFWESVGVPTQNLGPGEAYDGTLNWKKFADSRAGRRAPQSDDDAGAQAVPGADAGATGPSERGNGQAALARGIDQTTTPAFKKWFGDSKVVDDAGKPLPMYHGTSASEKGDAFRFFDTYASNYGLMGMGGYFTADPAVASSYTKKGRGDAPSVYQVYLSIKNPIDMEAKADVAAWKKRFDDVEAFHEGGATNESWFRAAEASLADQDLPSYEGAEIMQDGLRAMGFDGITHMGGSRVQKDGPRHRVYVAFDPEQVKSATGNNGDFDGGNPNIAFARGTGNLFKPNIWTTPDATRTDRVIYELQDGKVDLKRVQEAIKKSGQEIAEQYDARLAETLYPGRVAYRSKTFLDVEVKPLLEAMARNKLEVDELADYLHARGAQERNAQIAKVNPNMPDGGAGTNTKGVLMTNDAAAAYLANVGQAKRVVLDAMAKRVDAITAGTRKLLVDEGLEKQETIDAWEGAYKNYVPMFRDEAETAMPPHPQGSGFAVKGSASKRATGSTKKVTNILEHVLMQREAAITRAEKNRVALALYGQALSHPNPEFWTTIRPSMKAEEIGAELVAMGVDPMTAEVGMNGVPTIRTVDPITNKVVDRPNPIYKNLPGAIPLKVNGADRVLMLNVKHPRGQRLAESLKNLDGLTQLDLANSIIGKATRWLAAVNTQYNPAFGLVNLSRDVLEGAINLGSTDLRGNSTRVLAQVPLAIQGIARELATEGKGGSWGTLYKQFVADGGQTGFKENFRDPNDRARAVEKELQRLHSAGKLTPGNVAHAALDLLDGFNTTLENAVRLSAYKVGLEKGMSRAASARLARELTVDFNRKGRAGREVGPMYAFFNASVQGAERALRTLRGPTGAKIIAGGLALGVIQALMLAAAGYDDDEIPEYVKTRGFIIPLNWSGKGEKKHIIIPLPLGFLMVPNTGRVLTELTLNGGKDKAKRIVDAIGTIAGSFNPLGGGNIFTPDGALRTLAPTLVDPLIELGFNKNFAGSPIEKQAYGSETDGRPGAARAKESTQRSTTGQAYIAISKAINTLAGGTPYEAGVVSPTPERVRYLAQTVGGGVLREIEKTINATTTAASGGKVKSSQIPVLGRFYGEVDDDQVAMTRYYDNSKKLKTLESSLNAAKQAGDGAAMVKMLEEHPEAAFIKSQTKVQSEISKLNKQAVSTVNNPEVMKVIDAARVERMKALTEALEEMERARGKTTLGDRLRPKRQPEVAAAPP